MLRPSCSLLALVLLAACRTDPAPSTPTEPPTRATATATATTTVAPAMTAPAATTPAATATPPATASATTTAAPVASAAADPDDRAFQDARLAGMGNGAGACGGVEPVKQYLARFPAGKHAAEARTLLPQLEKDCKELEKTQQAAAPWIARQKQRQVAYLAADRCTKGCKGDATCEGKCPKAPVSKARCSPCTINGRCQILTSSGSPASLDCCLPMEDPDGCMSRP